MLIDPTTPASGAQADLHRLLALRFPARQLDVRRRRRALAQLSGGQRSNFRGRGIEFEEVRGYQAGDDIRAIDWRVTARTGSAHTKMFHEERERPVLLVVDHRPAMDFGSRFCFKSVLAAELAALLAWSALGSNERVGALILRHDEHWEMRPRNSRRTVLAVLSALAEKRSTQPADAAQEARFVDMLRSARRVARPGTSVFLLSDFAGADREEAQEEMFRLARHTEITAIHCSDPLEQALPPAGHYAITDGIDRLDLDTAAPSLKSRYAEESRLALEAHRERLQRLGIPLLMARTDEAPLSLLRRLYGDGVA